MESEFIDPDVVEEGLALSLAQLCRATRASPEEVQVWVVEGVLQPEGRLPQEWRFTGVALRRARIALTLTRELEVNAPGVALALDLMDQIHALRREQRGPGRR